MGSGLVGVARFAAASKGIKDSLNNIIKLKEAKQKGVREQEAFDLDKQESKLRIKRLEQEGLKSDAEIDNLK